MIPINTEFYTNNTALKYTVTKIWQGDDPHAPEQLLGSLPYLNNPLEDCSVSGITIEFEGIDRSASQIAIQQWGARLQATLSCRVDTAGGWTTMNMTTSYDYNADGGNTAFSGRNETKKASLWWGESLLAWYSIALTNDMHISNQLFYENQTDTDPIYKGHVWFQTNESNISSKEDVEGLNMFIPNCFFVPFSNNGVENKVYYCNRDKMENTDMVDKLIHAAQTDQLMPLPGIWVSAYSLTRAFYFTILTDLGQTKLKYNLLTDPDLLTGATKDYKAILDRPDTWGDNLRINNTGGLADYAFKSGDSTEKNLGVTSSVISTTFLCQVPRLKSRPTLVVSVIINTFVLLSALWKSYKFITDSFLLSRHPESMFCEGCAVSMPKSISDEASIASGQKSHGGDYKAIRQQDER
ncbi:hypothetical protein F53441_12286 [Fusarium austroafricanum]|uniref:Uncharacterized protein n=1 Tax=Fusarium austroafricanum TaxID=2364996 RepID=A0A8H4K041_9HYPO|nr:hypothetical protein F53441_12286 [Fusarium austroafricanum]